MIIFIIQKFIEIWRLNPIDGQVGHMNCPNEWPLRLVPMIFTFDYHLDRSRGTTNHKNIYIHYHSIGEEVINMWKTHKETNNKKATR